MKIFQETLDNETYLDVMLTPYDLEMLTDHFVISQPHMVEGQMINLGITLALNSDECDEH
jgi:hypothetical protein